MISIESVAAARRGHLRAIVEAVCDQCGGGSKATVAKVFDSPEGPLWYALLELEGSDRHIARRDLASKAQRRSRLPVIEHREIVVPDVDLFAHCQRHGRLQVHSPAVVEAVDRYRASGKTRRIRLSAPATS